MMAIGASPSNKWLFGGIVKTEVWPGDACVMNRWDGERVLVHRGEAIALLRTGSERATFVDVVPT